jgi:hypothetical protein
MREINIHNNTHELHEIRTPHAAEDRANSRKKKTGFNCFY